MILILVPLVLLGTGFGLAKVGILKVPGISPAKKAALAAGQYGEPKQPESKPDVDRAPKTANKKPPKREPKAEVVVADPEAGAKKLAKVWSALEADVLAKVVSDWKDPDLARVLAKMDAAKTAELLAVLEPKRASSLSRILEKLGAIPNPVRQEG